MVPQLLLKVRRDLDLYVVWSLESDWPDRWGTREALAGGLIGEHQFATADDRGVAIIGDQQGDSSWAVGGEWDSPYGLNLGEGGVLLRGDLARALDLLEEDPEDTLTDVLSPFPDGDVSLTI